MSTTTSLSSQSTSGSTGNLNISNPSVSASTSSLHQPSSMPPTPTTAYQSQPPLSTLPPTSQQQLTQSGSAETRLWQLQWMVQDLINLVRDIHRRQDNHQRIVDDLCHQISSLQSSIRSKLSKHIPWHCLTK